MRYWDTSALVPLVVGEPVSPEAVRLLGVDPLIATWMFTRTEMVSAIRRRERLGELDRQQAASALATVARLAAAWTEVDHAVSVRNRAERLLGTHALRATDALQLASALHLCREDPREWTFVCNDDRLCAAASAEGFQVADLGAH